MKRTILGAALALAFSLPAHAGSLPASTPASTMVGIDHVGISVPDLNQAEDFFTTVLGCENVFHLGPFADPEGTFMSGQLGTHQKATLNIATMRCGAASNVELFEFRSPSQKSGWPARDDIGSASIGFYVEDLDATLVHLKANGIETLGDVVDVADGPIAGRKWIYARAPWGLLVFFMSEPDGIAWDREDGVVHPFSLRAAR